MAELEHDAGIVSTFFVLADGQFYNPLERETVRQVRRIHALGHEAREPGVWANGYDAFVDALTGYYTRRLREEM